MKAGPRGLNAELMHDFGPDSLGQHHLYTAVVHYSFGRSGESVPSGLFCAAPFGLDDTTQKLTLQKFKRTKRITSPSVCVPLFLFLRLK